MHVLMISLDKSLATQPEGESVQRHLEYAERAGRITIVTYTPRLPLPAGENGTIRPSPHLTIHPTNSLSRLTYPLGAYRLGLRAAPVDLLTTQDPFVTGLVGWRLRGKLRAPLLVQNHSHFFGNQAWLDERPIRYRLFSRLGEFIVRRADMYRTVNQREREAYLALGGSPERVAVLPVMTASEKFAAPIAANMLHKVRDSLGLQAQHKVIIWVGRPIKTKRLPLLLQVFSRVADQEPEARLLLVGDMTLDIPALARELGISEKVILAGRVAHGDLPAYYHLAHVFAITSAYEGMPRVLGEAAAAGLPLVGMDSAAGVAEFIEDGVNGYICHDGDRQGMAGRILKLLRDPELAHRLGTAARELALTRYNAANNADAVVALWEKTIQMELRS